MRYANVYERIVKYGHDEDFVPRPCPEPTDAYPGSLEKVEILRLRVLAGVELWHPHDCKDYTGATGGYRQHHETKRSPEPAIRVYDQRVILFGTTKGVPE